MADAETARQLSAVVVGASGYSGGEVVSILAHHPHMTIAALFGSSRQDGEKRLISDLFPRLRGRVDLPIDAADVKRIVQLRPDSVFLATPHEASAAMAPELLAAGLRVFDLSGAFRLRPASLYEQYYGFAHARPDLLELAVYGLPELNRSAIAAADLIAVPGCYPTSAILPLAPLVRAGAIAPGTRPIVDSTSGVSGAGRATSPKTHFCEVSLQPYGVLKHRHNPEIDLHAGTPTVFTPHLGAFDRGILSTIHVELARGWTAQRISETLHDAYDDEAFIRLLPADHWPSIASVRGTNYCDIGWAVDEAHRHLIVVSAIDNLVKGAAGQAVQCMNIRYDLPETAGLEGAWA